MFEEKKKEEERKREEPKVNSLQSLPLVRLPKALFPPPPSPRAVPGWQHHLCLEVCHKQTAAASPPLQSQNLLPNHVPNEALYILNFGCSASYRLMSK